MILTVILIEVLVVIAIIALLSYAMHTFEHEALAYTLALILLVEIGRAHV